MNFTQPTIGAYWTDRNKRMCQVFDKYTTRNESGDVVKTEWVSFHMFLGQRVEHSDNAVTIAKGIARLNGEKI